MATDIGDEAGHPPSPPGLLARPPATHSTPLSSPSSRRRRRPINQFRGLPYASLSARWETGEAVGQPPACPSPSLSPRTRRAASPSPLLSSSDSATINIWCSGRQTDSSRLLQAAGPGRAACCCLVERQYGAGWPGDEAINILKAVSSYCDQPLSATDWLARSFDLHAHQRWLHCITFGSPPQQVPYAPSALSVALSLDPIITWCSCSMHVMHPIILSLLEWPDK